MMLVESQGSAPVKNESSRFNRAAHGSPGKFGSARPVTIARDAMTEEAIPWIDTLLRHL